MAINPYAAPQAEVRDIAAAEEYQHVQLWSPRGRVGRLRYLAWVFGFQFLVGVPAGILSAIVPDLAGVLVVALYLVVFVFSVLMAIKRSHDMDWSGWSVLLMLIPLAALIWVFKAGTEGPNRFGNPPPPNTTAIKIVALVVPILFIAGVIAAIAIPAYADYTNRAMGLQ